MKTLTVLFILLIFCFPNFLKSQEEEETESTGVELYVRNYTGTQIFVRFYPFSAVFNARSNNQPISKLSLKSVYENLPRIGPVSDPGPPLNYLVGLDGWALNNRGSQVGYFEMTASGLYNTLFLDIISGTNKADGLFGYGIYKLEFYYFDGFIRPVTDPIVIDCSDLNYSYTLPMAPDLYVDIYDPGITPPCDIRFHWAWGGLESVECPRKNGQKIKSDNLSFQIAQEKDSSV